MSADPFPVLRTEIAGVSVASLVEQFGTPTYVYDAAQIIQRIGELKPFDDIRFAQKACSNLAILDLVRQHGVLVDAVSAGEIRRALAAGYAPQGEVPPIVYTADIFDAEALELVSQYGIHVNCGSPDMLDQLAARCGGSEITLRVNPGFGHGHSQKTNTGGEQSKHGIWHEQIPDCVALAKKLGHRVVGLHMHIGSGTDMEHLSQVGSALETTATQIGETLRYISAGGGLPVPYQAGTEEVDISAYYQLWNAVRERLAEQLGHAVHLEIEPGRFLTAESGWLVSEIRAIKTMGENTFYLLDAGFNNLARPILYGAYHNMSIVPRDGNNEERLLQDVVIGGPLCESGDIFTQTEGGFVAKRALPKATVGDLIVLQTAGAYGFAMGSNYNSKPLAAEVLLHQGQPHLVRARQTFEDLVRGEAIPHVRYLNAK